MNARFNLAITFAFMLTIMAASGSSAQTVDMGKEFGIKTSFPCDVPRGGYVPPYPGPDGGAEPTPPLSGYQNPKYTGCINQAVGSRFTTEVYELEAKGDSNKQRITAAQAVMLEHKVNYGSDTVRNIAGWQTLTRNSAGRSYARFSKFCFVNSPSSGEGNQIVAAPNNTLTDVEPNSLWSVLLRLDKADACRMEPLCVAAVCDPVTGNPQECAEVMADPTEWRWECGFARSFWIAIGPGDGEGTVTNANAPSIEKIGHGYVAVDLNFRNKFDGQHELNAYWTPPYSMSSPWNNSGEVFWGTDGYEEDFPAVLYEDHGDHSKPSGGEYDWSGCMNGGPNTPCDDPDYCEDCPGEDIKLVRDHGVPITVATNDVGSVPQDWIDGILDAMDFWNDQPALIAKFGGDVLQAVSTSSNPDVLIDLVETEEEWAVKYPFQFKSPKVLTDYIDLSECENELRLIAEDSQNSLSRLAIPLFWSDAWNDGLQFQFTNHDALGQHTIHTASIPRIVAHELGHTLGHSESQCPQGGWSSEVMCQVDFDTYMPYEQMFTQSALMQVGSSVIDTIECALDRIYE